MDWLVEDFFSYLHTSELEPDFWFDEDAEFTYLEMSCKIIQGWLSATFLGFTVNTTIQTAEINKKVK